MPLQTLKNTKHKKRIVQERGTKVHTATVNNTTRKMKYKLPTNLLPPSELLKAKQKNKVNTKRNENKKRENAAKAAAAKWQAQREAAKRHFEQQQKKGSETVMLKTSNLLGITKKNAQEAYKNAKRKEFQNFLNKARKGAEVRGRQQTPKQVLKGKFWNKNSNSDSD